MGSWEWIITSFGLFAGIAGVICTVGISNSSHWRYRIFSVQAQPAKHGISPVHADMAKYNRHNSHVICAIEVIQATVIPLIQLLSIVCRERTILSKPDGSGLAINSSLSVWRDRHRQPWRVIQLAQT